MEGMSRTEFASAVHSAIAGVKHFCREVAKLNAALVEELQSDPEPFGLFLSAGKESRESRGMMLRDFYGQILQFDAESDEEELDTEEDPDSEEELEEESPRRKKGKAAEIDPVQPLLLLRVVLIDPSVGESFEPQVQYAILGDWGVGTANSPPPPTLAVKKYMLRRITREVAPGPASEKRIISTAKVSMKGSKTIERRLSFKVIGGVQSSLLYDLDKPDAVIKLVADVKAHWKRHTAVEVPA